MGEPSNPAPAEVETISGAMVSVLRFMRSRGERQRTEGLRRSALLNPAALFVISISDPRPRTQISLPASVAGLPRAVNGSTSRTYARTLFTASTKKYGAISGDGASE